MSRIHELRFFDTSKEAVIGVNGIISKAFDGSRLYNVKPPSMIINFTNQNDTGIVWSYNPTAVVTFTHTMTCYPIVQVYDASGHQVYPSITIISGTSFSLDFEEPTNPLQDNETWTCTVTYGAEYGSSSSIQTDFETMSQTMQNYVDEALGYVDAAAASAQEAQDVVEDAVKTTIIRTSSPDLTVSPGQYVVWTLLGNSIIRADMTDMTDKAGTAKVIIDTGDYSITCGNSIAFRIDGYGKVDALVARKKNECAIQWDGTGVARIVVLGTIQ